jgi:regulator of protease activity HflC (stomatin/prohibitin superfamily)
MSQNDDTAALVLVGAAAIALIAGAIWLLPQIGAYYSQVGGRGALLSAESTRQVRVLEAKAKLEAAALEADAEVRRAQGSAKAIAAIKGELGGDEYLRWLYIKNLEDSNNNGNEKIIYIPTDGLVPLPISEAGRALKK